ncbi:N-acetyltransferase [Streptomyces nigra]|uniref:N-acetyltransferase n=1 Tax=Streptomyces nigra TaxID=1827580 RepID=UPI003807CB6E
MTVMVPIGLAEQTEIKAYEDFVTGAPASVREAIGIESLRVDPAVAIAIRDDPSRFFNRAGGFAAAESLSMDVLERVCDFYREQRLLQGALMIAPPLLPSDWAITADKLGLVQGSRFVKLACDVETALSAADGVADLRPGLRVDRVGPEHADEWANIMMTTFGFTTPGMIEMAASCVCRPNWHQYAVWDEERIIAVGSVFINGECADMFGGATLAEGRGRGAQSALLTARARAAQAAGCRWIVAETGAEAPGSHNTSLHNMLRLGFEPLYERVTWLWRA